MYFYVETSMLNSGIATVTRAISNRSPMNILEGIFISASQEDGVLLRCSDLALQIDCTIPATVEEEGELVVPGRLFAEMVRKLSSEQTELKSDGNTLYLTSGRAKSMIQCLEHDEFPEMPFMGDEFVLELPQGELKTMISQTVFATAQEESKPILTGVLLELGHDELTMVALDGFRLALRRASVPGLQKKFEAVIPSKSLLEIARILDDSEEKVQLVFTVSHVLMQRGDTCMVARLLEGDFIKYKQILPKDYETRVVLNRKDMQESIERAMLMAREGKNNLVKFSFREQMLTITANSDIGKVREEVEARMSGADLDIAFNAKYVYDVLHILEDEEICLDMRNNVSPCVVQPVQGDRYYYLILPVRLFA